MLELLRYARSRVVHVLFRLWFSFSKSQTLPPVRNKLLLESATELAGKIRRGEVKSVDVVRAYIDRISQVQPVLNAVVADRFEDALCEASLADQLVLSRTKTTEQLAREKPLLGVPFTAKNSVAIRGLRQDAGSMYYRDQVAQEDAAVVRRLRDAGAIPLALTNVPELCMWGDTYNRLDGLTCNPYDTRRTPGGSSGGEGSLIAAGGSLLGVGTDLAGSIRIPSANCGVFGHRPTAGVVSNDGVFPQWGGDLSDYNCTGPMCRYAQDLSAMLKVMAGPNASRLLLDEEVDVGKLSIYYMEDDGSRYISCVSNDARLAVKKAVAFLSQGHTLRQSELKLEEFKYSLDVWLAAYVKSKAPPFGDVFKNQNEKMHHMKEALRTVMGSCKHTPGVILMSKVTSMAAIQQEAYIERAWCMATSLQQRIETLLGDTAVFLLPATIYAALFHHQDIASLESLKMTCLLSILKLPVTVCPIMLNKEGLPLGVQVVASRGQDRLSLAVARKLQEGFGGWRDPSAKI